MKLFSYIKRKNLIPRASRDKTFLRSRRDHEELKFKYLSVF